MTNKKSTSNQSHPTLHMLANPASQRSDLVYGESFPSWGKLYPLGTDSASATPLAEQVVPLNVITPRFAADLHDGMLTTALQFTDAQLTHDLLAEFLPECLQVELENSGDGYGRELVLGLMQRVDYLLRSLSSGVAPKPRCTADEWLLWVSCWVESQIARCGTCDECDPANQNLPRTTYDDLEMMSTYLLEDEDLLLLWNLPSHLPPTVERQNEFGVDIRDYRETLDPLNGFGFAPMHTDGWFEPFYGDWKFEIN